MKILSVSTIEKIFNLICHAEYNLRAIYIEIDKAKKKSIVFESISDAINYANSLGDQKTDIIVSAEGIAVVERRP